MDSPRHIVQIGRHHSLLVSEVGGQAGMTGRADAVGELQARAKAEAEARAQEAAARVKKERDQLEAKAREAEEHVGRVGLLTLAVLALKVSIEGR